MDDQQIPSGAAIAPEGMCPNGHDVPSWRSVCGVCGSPVRQAPIPDVGEATEYSGPSKRVWAVLLLLAIAAVAIPLLPGDDVVFKDDFSGPAVLRGWPEEAQMKYEDGEYHLSLPTEEGVNGTFMELPRQLDGVRVEADAKAVQGQSVVYLECISGAAGVSGAPGSAPGGISYGFALMLATGDYAILSAEGIALAEGELSAGANVDHIAASCVSGRESGVTALAMSVNGQRSIQYVDQGGVNFFDGVGFGMYAVSAPAEAAFDNLRVSEA